MLPERVVSGHHARLDRFGDVLHVTDLSSLNGTKVNGKKIVPGEPHPVTERDVISIGSFTLTLHSAKEKQADRIVPTDTINIATPRSDTPQEDAPRIPDLRGRTSLTIGRSPDNDVRIDHPTVSRSHARIVQSREGVYTIEDLDSTNGTFVNGERIIQPRVLKLDDIIHIGPYKLTYRPEQIKAVDESRHLRLDALHLKKFVGKGKNLLQDISLCIKPREFVAVVGMAGSGKTTLLDALNGFRPASEGRVLVNGESLYANFDAYRTQLGYVPQKNIVHMGLTAYEVLDYSARLRLPADTTSAERHKRVTEVLETLGISHCKDRAVSTLSGGEQRRVAMGVELLARPGLFFLDEVTSGLDPGTERQIMRLLRTLSRQGHTILLITHATKNVMECDMVVFLARGGYLAYYGPPQEALTYFGVKEFDDIYDKLQGERTPEAWGEKYSQSEQCSKYITERTRHKADTDVASRRSYSKPGAGEKRISSKSQFLILSRRNLNILMRDRASLILMLLMPLIVGLLDFLFWKSGMFDPTEGDATRAIITLNITAVICFLVGGLASMREIVKESDIYRRERMVAIKIAPYVLSKAWIAVIISLYSAGVFLLFMWLAGNWPPLDQMAAIYFTMFLALLAGMMTGLFISSLSPNQNVTPLLLVLFLVPQIIFGGMLPERYFGSAGSALGTVTTTRWAFESMVTISEMGECISDDACNQENCMGPNVLTVCDFPGIRNPINTVEDAQKSIASMKQNYGDAFSVNLIVNWGVLTAFILGLFVMVVGVLRWKDKR